MESYLVRVPQTYPVLKAIPESKQGEFTYANVEVIFLEIGHYYFWYQVSAFSAVLGSGDMDGFPFEVDISLRQLHHLGASRAVSA